MSDLRVAGFSHISFWQEDGIGVIVLRTKNGLADPSIFSELVLSVSQATIDDNVKCIAFTGLNLKFMNRIDKRVTTLAELIEYLETLRTFVSVIYSVKKNVYSIVNGDAINEGYEIALLSDYIISSDLARLGFRDGHNYSLLGSLTGSRFNYPLEGKSREKVNCDAVLPSSTLLEDAKKLILSDLQINRFLPRRTRWNLFEKAMNDEREAIIESFSKSGTVSQQNDKRNQGNTEN